MDNLNTLMFILFMLVLVIVTVFVMIAGSSITKAMGRL